METIVEICCGSYYDALQAQEGGAKRIELNNALHLGGLTPSLGTLKLIKEQTDLKVICMVRPRAGGFHYHAIDIEQMFVDAEILMQNGSDGIAFGFLNEDTTIDIDTTKKMISLIHKYNGEAVFHRAIDVTNNIQNEVGKLVELNCDRIITSGGKATVSEGEANLKTLQELYGKKIELLMGSGIRPTNAKHLIDATGINQIHSTCKAYLEDPTSRSEYVNYQFLDNNTYDVAGKEEVIKLIKSI